MKHIDVLREADLILTREEGRQRVNSLNVVPIRQIYERWVGRFEELWSSHLLRIKEIAENRDSDEPRDSENAKRALRDDSIPGTAGDVCLDIFNPIQPRLKRRTLT